MNEFYAKLEDEMAKEIPGSDQWLESRYQPERLNPEEEFNPSNYNDPNSNYWKFEKEEYNKFLCESPNTTNK